MNPRRSCRPRFPPASAFRLCCRRRRPPAPSRSRCAGPRTRSGRSRNSRGAGSFGPRVARRRRWMRPSSTCCSSWRPGTTRRSCASRWRSRKNILVSGPTGSGKTTWTKALIREIPADERLVTIEDAQELVLDTHPNHVRLFYSKDDQGLARVTPEAAPGVLPAHEAGPHSAGGTARGRGLRLPAQRELRSPGLHHEHPRRQLRARLRAAGAAGQAERRRSGTRPRRHQESPLSPGRCGDPVWRRAPRALHQGNLV